MENNKKRTRNLPVSNLILEPVLFTANNVQITLVYAQSIFFWYTVLPILFLQNKKYGSLCVSVFVLSSTKTSFISPHVTWVCSEFEFNH